MTHKPKPKGSKYLVGLVYVAGSIPACSILSGSNTNLTNMKYTVTTTVEISHQRMEDILVTWLESGYSNFWAKIVTVEGSYKGLVSGNTSWIIEVYDGPENPNYVLTAKDLRLGLTILANNHPKHFQDIVAEDYDAETADIFMQCCLFGEEVYA